MPICEPPFPVLGIVRNLTWDFIKSLYSLSPKSRRMTHISPVFVPEESESEKNTWRQANERLVRQLSVSRHGNARCRCATSLKGAGHTLFGKRLPKLKVAPPEASAMIRVDFPLSPVRALGIPPLSAGRTLPSCARPRFECRKACGRSIRAAAHRRSSGCEAALGCVSIFSRSRPCDHDSSPRETTARETSMPLAFAFARYAVDFCVP